MLNGDMTHWYPGRMEIVQRGEKDYVVKIEGYIASFHRSHDAAFSFMEGVLYACNMQPSCEPD